MEQVLSLIVIFIFIISVYFQYKYYGFSIAWKGFIVGFVVGVLIILYDLDFLLNPGGPEAYILKGVRHYFGTQGLFSIIIFIIPFCIIGYIIGMLIDKIILKKN